MGVARLVAMLVLVLACEARAAELCTYRYSVWNVRAKRSLRTVEIRKPRAQLTAAERGPFGCTPCREDQVEVRLSNGLRVPLCRAIAERTGRALDAAIAAGARLETLVGYRPQLSRGDVDAAGDRTQLSNHAFGVALDVNEAHNGLYDACVAWGPACRLVRGGVWSPAHPLSITADHVLVRSLAAAGLRWGGAIRGRQKDFMHFSPTGY